MVDKLRAEARGRSQANLKQGNSNPDSPELGGREEPKGKTTKILAEKAGIGRSSMESLMSVQRDAPDLFEQVKDGKITINKARIAQFLKEYWGVKRGGDQATKIAKNQKGYSDIASIVGSDASHLSRLIKLNDLIPELQQLVSTGKLGTTAGEQLA